MMFSAVRRATIGLTAALCALATSPRVAEATVVYTLFGNDPSAGGLISAVFSSNTFITIPAFPAVITPLPNLTTCIVNGGACTSTSLAESGIPPGEAQITLEFPAGGATTDFLESSFGAFGSYTSLNRSAVTLTVAEASPTVPEPATLVLFSVGLAGLGMVLRTRRG